MRKYVVPAIVWTAFVGLLLSGLSAQPGTGRIEGIVKDEVGAVLPGVTVTVSGPISPRTTTVERSRRIQLLGPASGRLHPDVRTHRVHIGLEPGSTVRTGSTEKVNLAMSPWVPSPRPLQSQRRRRPSTRRRQAARISSAAARGEYLPKSIAPYGFNTEAYDRIDDNQWTEVATQAALDLLHRRRHRVLLQHPAVPHAGAGCRRRTRCGIEELINYFSYDYPEPRDNAPFAVTTAIDSAPWNPRHRLALIGLQARQHRFQPPCRRETSCSSSTCQAR